MDVQQATLLEQMVGQAAELRGGGLPIDRLAANLRGLFDATGIRSPDLRDEFQDLWADIDIESELRTEPWAPPGAVSDERLTRALDSLIVGRESRWGPATDSVHPCRYGSPQ
jgi:hypothetical protein